MVNKALEAGGTAPNDPNVQEGMFGGGFQDLDGVNANKVPAVIVLYMN